MTAAGVRFVMIGGYAYNLYRNPRATGDIDFLRSCDDDNDRRLRSVLERFGFGETLPDDDVALLVDEKVITLGRSPFRIGLLTRIDGASFEEVASTCRPLMIDGMIVPVISPELLLKNKESTGRAKDLADAEELRNWLGNR